MKQRGMALLVVLLALVLATLTATELASQLSDTQQLTTVALHQQQALIYGVSGESWAMQILRDNHEQSDVDHKDESWANLPTAFPVTGGDVQMNLTDLQSRFNVNSLWVDGQVDSRQLAAFLRLLTALELPETLANALLDWMDEDDLERFPGGAESRFYLQQTPARWPANRPFETMSSLRKVAGITDEAYRRLQPFVTVLPTPTQVNINTADERVLQALLNVPMSQVNAVIRQRPFAQVEALHRQFPDLPPVSVKSRYFELRTTVQIGTADLTLWTGLAHQNSGHFSPFFRRWGTP